MVKFAVILDHPGKVAQVVLNESSEIEISPGSTLTELVDPDSRVIWFSFLAKLQQRSESLVGVELNLVTSSQIVPVTIGGARFDDRTIVVATCQRRSLAALWYRAAHLLRDKNDRVGVRMLRHPIAVDIDGLDVRVFDEISRINNELVTLQRELAKRNAELERLRRELEVQAITDPLTGVLNRRGLTLYCDREIERARRANMPLSIVMLDLDKFKSVNDTYGHHVGDEVLVETARRISLTIRRIDLLARYGGEEFLIVFPETTLKQALGITERIRKKIAEPFPTSAGDVFITVSAGIASAKGAAIDFPRLVQEADNFLFEAKAGGRNRVVAPSVP
ncbi:MAG: GGDEF domain-containing protein [Candidatus Sumerlaeaceae bacterium]|nr:GGDEF domain-containing protein [Candidatus Sumerlaeaceae bacterium]